MENKKDVLLKLATLSKDLKRRPTKWDNQKLYYQSRKHFGTWNNMMEEKGYEVKRCQYPKIPKRLTPELSYFLGLLITDGHLQYKKRAKGKSNLYYTYLFTSYEEEVEMIIELISGLFDYTPNAGAKKLFGFNKRISYQILINSKKLAETLYEKFNFPIGNKSLTARVPKCILNSNNKNKASFLRGVIDGDGSIKKNRCISLNSCSKEFLENINKILEDLNIKKKRIIKDVTTFVLYMANTRDIERLYEQCYENVIYCYPRKIMALERTIFKNKDSQKFI